MHIYKTFFKVTKQHKVSIIMYTCIIVFMLLAMTGGQIENSGGKVTLKQYSILLKDEDNSEFSKNLTTYLKEKHQKYEKLDQY